MVKLAAAVWPQFSMERFEAISDRTVRTKVTVNHYSIYALSDEVEIIDL